MKTRKNFDNSQFRNFAIAGAILLSGCASAPPAPLEVDIPIFTPCVKTTLPKPVYEFDKLPVGASAGAKVLALARDWITGRTYESLLEAQIAGCL